MNKGLGIIVQRSLGRARGRILIIFATHGQVPVPEGASAKLPGVIGDGDTGTGGGGYPAIPYAAGMGGGIM